MAIRTCNSVAKTSVRGPGACGCRELTHYKGEPDPLKGDVPNQRVRDAAREALDALFGAENGYAPTSMPAQPQLTVRLAAAVGLVCHCYQPHNSLHSCIDSE